MKKIVVMLIAVLCLSSLSSNVHANLQQNIKNHLHHYRNLLILIRDYKATNESYLLSGDYDELNTVQLQAAIEVLKLIYDGELDSCCWTGGTPNQYANFASLSTTEVVAGQSTTYTMHSGHIGTFTADDATRYDFVGIEGILLYLRNNINNNVYSGVNTHPDRIKRWELVLAKSLHNIWDDLVWAFSYVDDTLYTHPDITPEFRKHYAFACIVCFGAGFYDTSLLHTKNGNSYTAKPAWHTIYNKLSAATQQWMNTQADNQYPKSSTWNGSAPLQISMGPTFQGVAVSSYGTQNLKARIYPAHCHGATELYKTLDPVAMIRDKGTANDKQAVNMLLPYSHNYTLDVNTFVTNFGVTPFISDMYPVWYGRNIGGAYHNSYKETGIGSLFYNESRDYHSTHSGRWMQLTQWARLTSPEEGTSYPLHGINPIPNESCNKF